MTFLSKIKNISRTGALSLIGLLMTGCACQGIKDPVIRHANNAILPSSVPVYVRGDVVVNQPASGFIQTSVPVNNSYRKVPGCYIACYSKGGAIKGLVRVGGLYIGPKCEPQGYFFKDLSSETFFTQVCSKRISSCSNGSCWAGGNTGGLLSIPQNWHP